MMQIESLPTLDAAEMLAAIRWVGHHGSVIAQHFDQVGVESGVIELSGYQVPPKVMAGLGLLPDGRHQSPRTVWQVQSYFGEPDGQPVQAKSWSDQFSRPAPDSGVGPAGSPLSGGVVSSPRGASAGDGERMRPGKDAAPTSPGPTDDGSRECEACGGAGSYPDHENRSAECRWCDGGGTMDARTLDLYLNLFRSDGAA